MYVRQKSENIFIHYTLYIIQIYIYIREIFLSNAAVLCTARLAKLSPRLVKLHFVGMFVFCFCLVAICTLFPIRKFVSYRSFEIQIRHLEKFTPFHSIENGIELSEEKKSGNNHCFFFSTVYSVEQPNTSNMFARCVELCCKEIRCSFIVLMPSVRIYTVNSHYSERNTMKREGGFQLFTTSTQMYKSS